MSKPGLSKKTAGGKKASGSAVNLGDKDGGLLQQNPLEEIQRLRAELTKEREERNFFQLERDKINDFWQISQRKLAEAQAELQNKDREQEDAEERHQTEIKVYKQKVKHLLYEYQNNIAHVQTDAERQLSLTQTDHVQLEAALKKQARGLKLELKELELSHQEVIKNIKLKNDHEVTKLRADFDRRCKDLYNKYNYQTKLLREELELRRKNEIHEVEERKNSQINTLMKSHEKAFSEIKNYYNDITLNNLALINSLKEQVEDMKKRDERNERLMVDITAENKRLKEPLDAALADGDQLKRQLKTYEKDKLALQNTKGRLKVLEGQYKQLVWEKEVLEQRFEQTQKERDQLYSEFVRKCKELEQRVGTKNLLLEKKLLSVRESLEKKDLQLHELVTSVQSFTGTHHQHQGGAMDPAAISQITSRVSDVLDGKTQLVKDLQYELARVVKAHNDMLRVYECKMAEWNIPTEELGFRPLVVKLNTGAAADNKSSKLVRVAGGGVGGSSSGSGGAGAAAKRSEISV